MHDVVDQVIEGHRILGDGIIVPSLGDDESIHDLEFRGEYVPTTLDQDILHPVIQSEEAGLMEDTHSLRDTGDLYSYDIDRALVIWVAIDGSSTRRKAPLLPT